MINLNLNLNLNLCKFFSNYFYIFFKTVHFANKKKVVSLFETAFLTLIYGLKHPSY